MRRLVPMAILLMMMISCSDGQKETFGNGLIVLMSDFGLQDSSVGEIKGVILSSFPDAKLVDLSHQVEPGDIRKGAVALSGAASCFPAKTIFLAVVESGATGSREPILLLSKEGKYYLGPNNGLFTFVAEREGIERVWSLDKVKYFRNGLPSSTFYARDIYASVAAALAKGESSSLMGTPLKKIDVLPVTQQKIVGNTISGEVLYADRYGNVVTNISASFANNLKMGALVKVILPGSSFSAPYVETSSKAANGRALIMKNSQGLIEISLNQGSISKSYSIKAGTQISLQP